MKRNLLFRAIAVFCILHTICCFPQETAINITGACCLAMPDTGSADKVMPVTRMHKTAKPPVSNPANGLPAYQTYTGTDYEINCSGRASSSVDGGIGMVNGNNSQSQKYSETGCTNNQRRIYSF